MAEELTRTYELELPLHVRYQATGDAAANKIAGHIAEETDLAIRRGVSPRPDIRMGYWTLTEDTPEGKNRPIRDRRVEGRLWSWRQRLTLPLGIVVIACGAAVHEVAMWAGGILITVNGPMDQLEHALDLRFEAHKRQGRHDG